jgi:hypothetical protein
MVGCEYGETVPVTTRQGDEEMQVILGGSGLTKSGIHVYFSLLPEERERMRRSAWDSESRIAEVDCLASWFCVRWVVGGCCEVSLECEAPKMSSNQTTSHLQQKSLRQRNRRHLCLSHESGRPRLTCLQYSSPLSSRISRCRSRSLCQLIHATREQPYHPNSHQSIQDP